MSEQGVGYVLNEEYAVGKPLRKGARESRKERGGEGMFELSEKILIDVLEWPEWGEFCCKVCGEIVCR